MIDELELIREEIYALEKTVEAIKRKRTANKLLKYTHSLLTIKENLIKLRRKLRRLPETTREDKDEKTEAEELIDVMLFTIAERERDVEKAETQVLVEDVKSLRSVFSEISGSLPIEQTMFLVDISHVPQDIREEIKLDFEEIRKCYYAEAFRSAIGICGRVLEILLARKYYEEKGIDATEQQWTIGQLIRKCFEENVIDEPALGDISNLINRSRIDSVHSTRRLYRPQSDDAKSIIEFTISLVRKLFPPST